MKLIFFFKLTLMRMNILAAEKGIYTVNVVHICEDSLDTKTCTDFSHNPITADFTAKLSNQGRWCFFVLLVKQLIDLPRVQLPVSDKAGI